MPVYVCVVPKQNQYSHEIINFHHHTYVQLGDPFLPCRAHRNAISHCRRTQKCCRIFVFSSFKSMLCTGRVQSCAVVLACLFFWRCKSKGRFFHLWTKQTSRARGARKNYIVGRFDVQSSWRTCFPFYQAFGFWYV